MSEVATVQISVELLLVLLAMDPPSPFPDDVELGMSYGSVMRKGRAHLCSIEVVDW